MSSRDEDRAILIELKTKGASRETFSALSEKLNKPSGQVWYSAALGVPGPWPYLGPI